MNLLSQESEITLHAIGLMNEGLRLFYAASFSGNFNPYDISTWGYNSASMETLESFLGVCAHLGFLPDLGTFRLAHITYVLGTYRIRLGFLPNPLDPLPHNEQLYQLWLRTFERTLNLVLNPDQGNWARP